MLDAGRLRRPVQASRRNQTADEEFIKFEFKSVPRQVSRQYSRRRQTDAISMLGGRFGDWG